MFSLHRRFLPLALLALSVPALAQQGGARLYVVTYVDVYPNFAADTVKAFQALGAASKQDTGYVRLEILRDTQRTNHFTIVEVWENRQAYEAHLATEHTKQFRAKLAPWLGSPFDDRFYGMLE